MKQENNSAKSAKYVYTIFWCSIVITVIAVGVVAIMCYKGGCFGIHSINFGDASVAALCAITTILLGWNIYSVIDMKNLKEEAEKRVDKLVEERMGDMYVCLLSYVDSSNVDSDLMNKHPEMAIDFLFTALDSSVNRMYNTPVINASMTRLYAICANSPYKVTNIYKFKKNHYLSILSDIKHGYKDYVASVISKSNETIDCPYGKGESFVKV